MLIFVLFLYNGGAPANAGTNSVGVQSEGTAERGGVGEFRPARAEAKPPAALLVQSRVPQKSFLFPLEEKEIARQIKKCEENFLRNSERSERWRGGAFKFRSPDFRQKKFGFRPTNTTKPKSLSLRQRLFVLVVFAGKS
ncbi:MAG: hypothetical protein PHW31_00545 [Candidatus Pacebacteria bacterium]|nr:hypothetical protein [Candidatus Paceibacterota bacterium]